MDTTRRAFFAAAGALALGSSLRSAQRSLRLGGPVFLKSDDPKELAKEHRRLGYSAGYCPESTAADTARNREIEKAFAAENVLIAEVGAWKNLLDPDPQRRKENLQYVTERLALAEEVGARCCVDIAGSFNPNSWMGPHPNNLGQEGFDTTVENCRKIVDAVKPKRTKFALKMMGWTIPDSPETYLKVLHAVGRAGFGVHMDVCSAINSPSRYYRISDFISECFKVLGKWVVSSHATDLDWQVEENLHFIEVVPGRGNVDYVTYLRELAKLSGEIPILMEHLGTPAEYQQGKRFIEKMGVEAGVAFA
jgi:sugar phosphate isomerase/epimerase